MNIRVIAEILGVVGIAILGWFVYQKPVAAPVGRPTEATNAPEVAKDTKHPIVPAKVLTYNPSVKQKTDVPQAVKDDPAVVVVDSSTVPASSHSQTVTEVLNTVTGDTSAYVTTDPYPWLAMENEKRFTLAYGIKNRGVKVFRFQYAHELVQIKALHIGPLITLDTDGQGFAGIAVRW